MPRATRSALLLLGAVFHAGCNGASSNVGKVAGSDDAVTDAGAPVDSGVPTAAPLVDDAPRSDLDLSDYSAFCTEFQRLRRAADAACCITEGFDVAEPFPLAYESESTPSRCFRPAEWYTAELGEACLSRLDDLALGCATTNRDDPAYVEAWTACNLADLGPRPAPGEECTTSCMAPVGFVSSCSPPGSSLAAPKCSEPFKLSDDGEPWGWGCLPNLDADPSGNCVSLSPLACQQLESESAFALYRSNPGRTHPAIDGDRIYWSPSSEVVSAPLSANEPPTVELRDVDDWGLATGRPLPLFDGAIYRALDTIVERQELADGAQSTPFAELPFLGEQIAFGNGELWITDRCERLARVDLTSGEIWEHPAPAPQGRTCPGDTACGEDYDYAVGLATADAVYCAANQRIVRFDKNGGSAVLTDRASGDSGYAVVGVAKLGGQIYFHVQGQVLALNEDTSAITQTPLPTVEEIPGIRAHNLVTDGQRLYRKVDEGIEVFTPGAPKGERRDVLSGSPGTPRAYLLLHDGYLYWEGGGTINRRPVPGNVP